LYYPSRWEIFTLKVAALVFLLLAGMALEAAGAEGSSDIITVDTSGAFDFPSAEGSPDLPLPEIDASEILKKIQKGQAVKYDHIIVKGDLDLRWENTNITSPISISDSIFEGKVSFTQKTIEMPIDLSRSNFTKDADFWGATFSEYAGFSEAIFSRSARFEGITFSKNAIFRGATFNGYAGFRGATFSGHADFVWTIFSGDADFGGATFMSADFWRATFIERADFMRAASSGNADFSWAKFSDIADFGRAAFGGGADFRKAEFIGITTFGEAEFNGNIEFGSARFENETSFYRSLFKRPAYFENCSINSLNLTKADFGRLHLHWGVKSIESLHFDEAAYLALIKNYNNLGWYGDANGCYYDYRNAVRKNWMTASSTVFPSRLSNLLDWLSNLPDWFVDFMEWLLYGYGVKPFFPIAWSASIILAFGLFFRRKRCLRKIITEERIENAEEGSDEVQIKTTARKAEIGALDPILFSLFTFSSGFTAFLHPTIEYKLERCVRWAIFERLLGPFFMALVITTISKTYLIR
jgi:uncharacterized protein YjbI with pentapeptide repeats